MVELLGHLVEARRQLGELVAGRHGNTPAESTGADPACTRDQVADRPEHGRRDQEDEQDRLNAGDDQRIPELAAENTAENRVSAGERYARIYEINMSRCIFCGYCELACPFDAITLGNEFEISEYSRDDLIYTKDMLLAEPIKRVPVQDPSLYDTPIPYYEEHS